MSNKTIYDYLDLNKLPNTQEESLFCYHKEPKECSHCVNSEICAYREIVKLIKPVHDLRKDKNDLPTEDGFYIACVENPRNHTRSTREVRFHINEYTGEAIWYKNNRRLLPSSVIAWKEFDEIVGE